jgi:hypothetical protein
MQSAGLTVTQDAGGNLIGRRAGRTTAPVLMLGSHTDTVMGGGQYDGIIGVLGRLRWRESCAMQVWYCNIPSKWLIFWPRIDPIRIIIW